MICHFLLLKAPKRRSKLLKNSLASQCKKLVQFTTPAKMSFPSQQEPSPAFTACQLNVPRQVQQPGEVAPPQKLNSRASVIAKEELYHRQDHCCSFLSVPWGVFNTGEENRPRWVHQVLAKCINKSCKVKNKKITGIQKFKRE